MRIFEENGGEEAKTGRYVPSQFTRMGMLNELQIAMIRNLDDEDPNFNPDDYDQEYIPPNQ